MQKTTRLMTLAFAATSLSALASLPASANDAYSFFPKRAFRPGPAGKAPEEYWAVRAQYGNCPAFPLIMVQKGSGTFTPASRALEFTKRLMLLRSDSGWWDGLRVDTEPRTHETIIRTRNLKVPWLATADTASAADSGIPDTKKYAQYMINRIQRYFKMTPTEQRAGAEKLAPEIMTEGDEMRADGKPDKAVLMTYQAAIDKDPKLISVRIRVADLLLKMKPRSTSDATHNAEDAKKHLEAAKANNPTEEQTKQIDSLLQAANDALLKLSKQPNRGAWMCNRQVGRTSAAA